MSAREWHVSPGRRWLVLGLLLVMAVALIGRAVHLQLINTDFLQGQGDARHLRVLELAATRGAILDRNGEPLALSTPVDSVWVNPGEFLAHLDGKRLRALARLLDIQPGVLKQRVAARANREFVYLRRHLSPELAAQVMALDMPGMALKREYRRYYPMGEVTGHLLGFTNVDDIGQEGIELAYDKELAGVKGSKRVIKDRLGRIVEDVESLAEPRPGHDLVLSIDRRIQYLAYRELKAAVQAHGASSGTAVVLDAQTGEILAMVNQPMFNPNNRTSLRGDRFRNRALTDLFEPGSTVKPFTVAAALDAGVANLDTRFDTSPGFFRVGRAIIRDTHDYGVIDLRTLLQKSSNIGAARLALGLKPQQLWQVYHNVGFGSSSGSGFPGEREGVLSDPRGWRDIHKVTLSYGYGISVTALQLARAYAVLANDGLLRPVSFVRIEAPLRGVEVMNPKTAMRVRGMLESVVEDAGTGTAAAVEGYRVAGKTGTVHISDAGGYAADRYLSLFAGIAPASRPRLVMAVVIKEPSKGEYYGGAVAAPVFGRVMAGALRLLNIPPDDVSSLRLHQAANDAGFVRTAAAEGL